MAILNIDRYLDKSEFGIAVKNRVFRVGVELEGGWTAIPEGANWEHDGSVKNLQKAGSPPLKTGEIPSPVLIPIQMWAWIRKNYPTHINETCGMHVHQSFESALNYQRLMVLSYQDTMMEYLKKWAKDEGLCDKHPIWDRLNGKNKYCQLKFWPDKQASKAQKSHNMETEGHRYTAINYCYAKDGCKTLEVRVLPMFDSAEQAIRAVKRVIAVTNACLVVLGRKEPKVMEEISIYKDAPPYIEHTVESVGGW